MHQVFFSTKLRRYTHLFFFSLCIFFSFTLGAAASERCPAHQDYAMSSIKYQLFMAYQTGYDGYQTPCEIKCFEKEPCTSQCQLNKGLEYLSQQLTKLEKKNKVKSCESYKLACVEQCEKHGQACVEACQS